MKRFKKNPDDIHLLQAFYTKKFRCGRYVSAFVDKDEDWKKFNAIRTTSIKEATCRDCLEWAASKAKKELRYIENRLWETSL